MQYTKRFGVYNLMVMSLLCGIDEAGRGPVAGPVTAAAVILPDNFPVNLLNDSKKLTLKSRERVLKMMFSMNVPVGIGWSWPEEIDRINIHNATLLAMARAYTELKVTADKAVIDGLYVPQLPIPAEAKVKADASVPEVMAASIAAKVIRDRWMIRYSWFEPDYGYDRHKGYPTKSHREACIKYGPSPIQRMSFRIRL